MPRTTHQRFTVIFVAALALTALAVSGCDDEADSPARTGCDDAVDHIRDCNIEIPDSSIDTDNCSVRDECLSDCITEASCESLRGEDTQGVQDYAACAGAC